MASNRVNVPEARNALDTMKYEIARELGINLKQGYNGDLTSRDNGYVGGNMVNIRVPVRIRVFSRRSRAQAEGLLPVRYEVSISF